MDNHNEVQESFLQVEPHVPKPEAPTPNGQPQRGSGVLLASGATCSQTRSANAQWTTTTRFRSPSCKWSHMFPNQKRQRPMDNHNEVQESFLQVEPHVPK